jgi:hypothetical protein
MKNDRSMVLAATPMEPVELKTVFSDQPESIRRRLEMDDALAPATTFTTNWTW